MLIPVVIADGWLCRVMSGSGLSPPGESSVDPVGIPTRPTVPDRDPRPAGEEAEAVGLADAVAVPPAQVPEAFPETPVESNKGVGTGKPDVMAPVAVIVLDAVEASMPEVPGMDAVGCAEAPMPEHAAEAVIEPSAAVPASDALTPGVASSVAPSGMPVAPTGAPGPIPSGEVTPSEAGAPVTIPTWANAGLHPNKAQVTTAIRNGLMVKSSTCAVRLGRETIGRRHEFRADRILDRLLQNPVDLRHRRTVDAPAHDVGDRRELIGAACAPQGDIGVTAIEYPACREMNHPLAEALPRELVQ